MKKIKELCVKYRELLMYLIFGVLTTLVNWVVYSVLVKAFSVDLSKVSGDSNAVFAIFTGNSGHNLTMLFVANIIAWAAGVVFAFVTNKIWVFESKSWEIGITLKELWKFVAARLITGVMEWFGIPLLVIAGMRGSFLGIEGFPAKVVVSVVVVILNYVFSKFLIFKNKKKEEADAPVNSPADD